MKKDVYNPDGTLQYRDETISPQAWEQLTSHSLRKPNQRSLSDQEIEISSREKDAQAMSDSPDYGPFLSDLEEQRFSIIDVLKGSSLSEWDPQIRREFETPEWIAQFTDEFNRHTAIDPATAGTPRILHWNLPIDFYNREGEIISLDEILSSTTLSGSWERRPD